jgi:hypothetical protein
VGGFYLGKVGAFVREVQYETPGGLVGWRDYDHDNGEPVSSGACSKGHLAQWAERELAPDELPRMQTKKADEVLEARNSEVTALLLPALSDEQLLAELRRRGIDVSQAEQSSGEAR